MTSISSLKFIMDYCRICQFSIKPEINIFKQSLGDPPVPIIQLINDCIQGRIEIKDKDFYQSEIQLSYICLKCSGKLLIYYKASLIMKKIKEELYALMEKAGSQIDVLEESIDAGTAHIDGNINPEVKIVQSKIPDNEEFIKMEYVVDNTDDLIDNVEDELVLDDMSTVLKSEILEQTNSNKKLNTYHEIIEIEELNVDEFNENSHTEEEHIKIEKCQSSRQSISCADCSLLFPNKRTYLTHRRQEHFAGYVCDQCGKSFYSQSGFITHRHSHKPVKDFVCSVCGEGYHHKNYLKRHMAWHSGEMPFQCDVCSKRFVHKVALYKHKKIHENVRNIECSECGFKFRTKAHLNRHMMTHTGAKPHSCPVCGKCFSQVYNMKVHVKEHESPGSTRRNRIRCKNCSKTFSHKEKYDIHIQQNQC